jgi:hypothetical protein
MTAKGQQRHLIRNKAKFESIRKRIEFFLENEMLSKSTVILLKEIYDLLGELIDAKENLGSKAH